MKIVVILLLLVVASTRAEMPRIDGRKQADVNGKIIRHDQLQFKTLPTTYHGTTRSPLSDKSVPSGTVPVVILDQKRTGEKVLNFSRRSYATLPQKNFTAKRASPSGKSAQKDKVVETAAAPITDRTIHATTPAGESELKDQLRKLKTRNGE